MLPSTSSSLLSLYVSSNHQQITQQLQQTLTRLANQSITEPIEEKEQLFKQFYNTVYSGFFDDLDGGLIVNEDLTCLQNPFSSNINDLFHKPTSINLSLCRLFFAADLVFYHGEFREVANKSLKNICSYVNHSDALNPIIENDCYRRLPDFNFCFKQKDLVKVLEKDEQKLLDALTKYVASNTYHYFTKSCSLKRASEKIGMPYKESQIVEYRIKEKLKSFSFKAMQSKQAINRLLENHFQINCELVETLVDGFSSTKNEIYKDLAVEIFIFLEKRLSNTNSSNSDALSLICSGISLLTLNFDQQLLKNIQILILNQLSLGNHLLREDNNQLNEEIERQHSLIITFLKSLPKQFERLEQLHELSNRALNFKIEYVLIFLDKQLTDTSIKINQLRSNYNSFQKLFVI